MLVQKKVSSNKISQSLKKILDLENLVTFSIAALPLYLVKLNFFGIPTNILEIMQATVILIWCIGKKSGISEIKEKYGKYIVAFGLLLFGLALSSIVNGNYQAGLGIIKGWFLLPALFAFVAVSVVDSEAKIKKTLLAFYFSSLAVSSIALIYYISGSLTYDGRLEAFFNSPNYLAMYLAPALISGLALPQLQILKIKNKIFNFYYISYGIILISFYLTFSYAAWVAVAAACSAAFILIRKNYSRLLVGTMTVLTVALFFQLSTTKWNDSIELKERSSLASRIMIWKAAGKIAEDNLVWGIGPGNFQNKYLEYQRFFPPYLEWAVPHPHNLFLSFFLYSGLTGLIGFSALVLFWFRDTLKKENSELKAIYLAIMLYIIFHGLADTTYFKNDLATIFWLNFLVLNLKKAT